MNDEGSGPAPTEHFGPAAANLTEDSSDAASGYEEPPTDAALEDRRDEGEARLSPNESEVPRQSFAEQLGQGGEG
jgi:hypothetical protein